MSTAQLKYSNWPSKVHSSPRVAIVIQGNRAVVTRDYQPQPNKGNISVIKVVTGDHIVPVRVK